ncbi:MAG TPA: class I SAM-dependent methyltransferase [Syntrophorhabdales bacterium]|nr:class I SAM-dependent methyltransferase [Syntrophorhabdales bacterium]
METCLTARDNRTDHLEYAACDICQKANPEHMFQENGFYLNRCKGCGHFYVSPRPTEGNTHHVERWDLPAPADHATHELSRTTEFEAYVTYARRHLARGTWLDIGCGCGTLLNIASRAGFKVEGVETDPERATYCRRSGLNVHDRDIMRNFLTPSSYDVVSMINVFSHLRSPTTAFASLHRLLRPGGLILVATSQLGRRAYKSEVPDWHIPDHLHFAGPETFKRIADTIGFELYCVRSQPTQKALICQKLVYRSEKRAFRAAKKVLGSVPGLIDISALAVCCARRYLYPRREVVMLFVRKG